MKKFKSLLYYDEARALLLERVPRIGSETVPVERSFGRVCSADVACPMDSPPFDRAAMDGFAVRSHDTFHASEASPLSLRVVGSVDAGGSPPSTVGKCEAMRIMTGAPLPDGADAVVMAEHVTTRDGTVVLSTKAAPHLNVSRAGEDMSRGDVVVSRGTLIGPQHVALLASAGVHELDVFARPRFSIITTGDELVALHGPYRRYGVYDSNGAMLSSLVCMCGGEVTHRASVPDRRDDIEAALERGQSSADVVVFTGGSSFGDKDLLSELISPFVFHGVAIKPGKPLGFASLERPTFVFSGYPVAAFVQFYLFVIPLLEQMLETTLCTRIDVPVDTSFSSTLGRSEFVRARIFEGRASPVPISGSSMLTSLTQADGYLLTSPEEEGVNEGEMRTFTYFL
ncbi:molybdopterin molybdenumtransferase MoeA [archaeon]|nr:MAG: molybdopterin molybdenumtransferase MoeA [archaeon]